MIIFWIVTGILLLVISILSVIVSVKPKSCAPCAPCAQCPPCGACPPCNVRSECMDANKWRCVGDIRVPVRRCGNDVYCASTDGERCMWQQSNEACRTLASNIEKGTQAVKPLACKAEEFRNPRSWCSAVKRNTEIRD